MATSVTYLERVNGWTEIDLLTAPLLIMNLGDWETYAYFGSAPPAEDEVAYLVMTPHGVITTKLAEADRLFVRTPEQFELDLIALEG